MSIKNEVAAINSSIRRKRKIHKVLSLDYRSVIIVFEILLSIFFLLISFFILKNTFLSVNTSIESLSQNIVQKFIDLPEGPIEIKEYKVQKGDTLYSISKKLGTSLSTLVSLNKLSSQSLQQGKILFYANKDLIKHISSQRFSVFDASRKYNVHPYEIFVVNGYKIWFNKECIIPGKQLTWNEISERLGIGFLKPLLGRFTSGFGYRIHPILGVRKFHSGLDISAPYGSPVKSSMSGVVQKVGYDEDGYGYYIIVKHYGNTKTLYGHLSKILVREGQKVKRGQIIGKVGNTGMTTGPHLHFEVIKNGRKVNPRKFIIR